MKVVKAYVSEEVSDSLAKVAKTNDKSVSSYLSDLITQALTDAGEITEVPDDSDTGLIKDKIHIYLTGSDALLLTEKADRLKITPTSYIRMLNRSSDLTIYDIETDDIRDYIAELHSVVTSLTSTVKLIKKSGKGEVYEQDVAAIKGYADEIKKLMNKQIAATYTTRKQVIKDVTKKARKKELK